MENLEFESINNFRIATSVDGVVKNLDSSKTSTVKDDEYDSYIVQSVSTNLMWMGIILLSIIIWVICIISLILNCVRKNVGKAIFSGIGIAVPIVSMIISTIGHTLVLIESETAMFLCILAMVLEIVVGIISFIFLFSKDKRKM